MTEPMAAPIPFQDLTAQAALSMPAGVFCETAFSGTGFLRFLVTIVLGFVLIPAQPVLPFEKPFSFRVVATGLDYPWQVTWGPDSHIWVTERKGNSS